MRRTITVAGIDPSSKKIAIVETRTGNTKKPFIHVAHLQHDRIEENQGEAFDFIWDFCNLIRERDGQPPTLFLEAPVMGIGGPGATIPQAYVDGSIMAGAHRGGSRIMLINNSTWKKRVLGNGNISKDKIGPWVKENWPELYNKAPLMTAGKFKGLPDQDILDAGCISQFGWRWVKMFESLKRRHTHG